MSFQIHMIGIRVLCRAEVRTTKFGDVTIGILLINVQYLILKVLLFSKYSQWRWKNVHDYCQGRALRLQYV